jgi:hypothetical protein
MFRTLHSLTMTIPLITDTAMAQTATPQDCFQVIAPVAPGGTVGAPPAIAALKVNRCTGETWVLSLLSGIGSSKGQAWRWTPLSSEPYETVWPAR